MESYQAHRIMKAAIASVSKELGVSPNDARDYIARAVKCEREDALADNARQIAEQRKAATQPQTQSTEAAQQSKELNDSVRFTITRWDNDELTGKHIVEFAIPSSRTQIAADIRRLADRLESK